MFRCSVQRKIRCEKKMKFFWITSSISLVNALYDPLFETNDLTYRIFEGEENTSFGYSLTLSNNNEILVGAPRKDREKTYASAVAMHLRGNGPNK